MIAHDAEDEQQKQTTKITRCAMKKQEKKWFRVPSQGETRQQRGGFAEKDWPVVS
jgi:hypothetical protein